MNVQILYSPQEAENMSSSLAFMILANLQAAPLATRAIALTYGTNAGPFVCIKILLYG